MRSLTIQIRAVVLTFVGSIFVICIITATGYSQGTIQRQVKISNANGNIVTLQTDTPTTSYTLNFPNNPNPSLTTASLLFGLGNGNMAWSSTIGADSGSVLQLNRIGGKLVPSWRSMSNLNYVTNDEPILTFSNDRGSLSDNRVFSVGTGLSVTNSGVDNGSLIVANTGVLKLTAGSGITVSDTTGNIVISSSGWQLNGNTSTSPWDSLTATGNFLGTSDESDLVLGTGSTLATRAKLRIFAGSNNILLARRGAQLQFRSTNGLGITTLEAGAQGNTDINYIFPTSAPTSNGQALTASTAGVLSWTTVSGSGGLTGSGQATRIAFWGPGPGTTTNLQDDSSLYWDNTNKRLSIGAGSSPTATLQTVSTGAATANTASASFNNTATSSTNSITKTGLDVQSTGSWTGTGATNIGLNVNATGGTINYAALLSGGNVGIGTSTPSQLLEMRNGNLLLSNNNGTAGSVLFQGTGTGATTLVAGAQGTTNITLTLPTAAPTANGQVLSSSTTGTLSWITPTSGGGLTGSGTATRIAFWGPGPGATTNLMDDASLYWDNTNKRLGIGTISPSSSIDVSDGSVRISNTTGTAGQLRFQGTGAGITTFQAGAQGATNLNYTLPTAYPTTNGQALTATTAGVLSWATVSGGSGSGWSLTGNAGTTAGTNFIGTTDNIDWVIKTNNTERIRVLGTGETGMGITTPNTTLDINGDLAIREYNYATAIPSTFNNANFDGANNQIGFVRLSSATSPFSITGIVGGVNGKMMSIYNATSQSMTIVNQSASSTAANRFITGTSANIPLPAGGTVNLLYSAQDSRWIVRSISGTAGWLYTGNSGLVDGTSNFHGTLDSLPIRFVAGNNGPRQRMVLDPRGNLLFGANSATTTFASGSAGKLAFGDSLNTLRLNSLPTYGARVFNMIDPNAVMRVWRFNSNAGSTDPAVELIGGTEDIELDGGNTKWDFYTTGTPGVPLSGTRSQGEHFAIRRRTEGRDSVYMSVFAGSGVRIGTDSAGTARYTANKLAVMSHDQNTNGIMDVAALEHMAIGSVTAGFGSGLVFRGETSTGNNMQDMARIAGVWTNTTNADRSAALTFSTVNDASSMTERVRIAPNGYVGINNTNPVTSMDINGAYATKAKTITLSNGRNDNIAIGDASFVRITGPTAAFSLSGIADGTNGKRVRIANMTGHDWTIMDSSSFSTLGNRIETNTNSDIIVSGPVPILDMIYDSVSNQWLLGTLNANQIVGAVGSIIYKQKTADESVTSSATIQDDDHLSFNVNAGETWELTGEVQADNTSNSVDVKVAFQLPTGTTMRIYSTGIQNGGTTLIQGNSLMTTSNTAATMQIDGGVSTLISFRGIFVTGSNAGTVKFRWAQGTSNNSTTTVRAYSYMKLIRVK